jgi:glycerol-3-phosphate dehydrogenase (NAD(P)+)
MNILVIGAGAWGTALAVSAASASKGPDNSPSHAVTLWARNAAQLADMQARHENQRYLPGVNLPNTLVLSAAPQAQLPQLALGADLLVIATPMAALRGLLSALRDVKVPVAWLCKGFEAAQGGQIGHIGMMAHEIRAQAAPDMKAGALSGPSFALEVARGQPTALVAASQHASVREALVKAFHSPSLRVYANEDIAGVEVGGAVKNVLAIATGLCDGLGLGLNARAALITRGLAEMTRFGMALGAKAETFMGLSGLGDLVLTATGDLSRNRKIGLALASGQTLQQAVDSLGHVAEGVYCARTVVQRAAALGIDMPISKAVVALLDGEITAKEAVGLLMGREARDET